MLAIVLLPRQFHMTVVENVDERHLNRAIWMFPLYLLAINLFVLPIAVGGLVRFDGTDVSPDTYVLALPMADGAQAMALFAYLGGLSAATAMVIVETIALSTMVSNNLVMPALVRGRRFSGASGLGWLVLAIRRVTIVVVLLLGYVYFRAAGEATALVSIGLLSFAAVAQFAPALFGGLFWKEGNRYGALAGMLAGFVVWAHTLLLPSLARSGWLSENVLEHGPFGIEALRPEQLLGLTGFDHISHGMFWSMLRERRPLRRRFAVHAPEPGRAGPGGALRRRLPRLGGGPGAVAPERLGRPARGAAGALPRGGAGRRGDRRLRARARARGRCARAGRRRDDLPRGDAARRSDRRLVGPGDDRLGGRGGAARARGGHAPARRDLGGDRLQPRARAQVARARGGERGAARSEPAAPRARPHEGRLRLDRDPRAAHAAHVDARLRRDPARQRGAAPGGTRALPAHHRRGGRAAHAADRPGARPLEDGVRPSRSGVSPRWTSAS